MSGYISDEEDRLMEVLHIFAEILLRMEVLLIGIKCNKNNERKNKRRRKVLINGRRKRGL